MITCPLRDSIQSLSILLFLELRVKRNIIPGVFPGPGDCTFQGCPNNGVDGRYPKKGAQQNENQREENKKRKHYCEHIWYKVCEIKKIQVIIYC